MPLYNYEIGTDMNSVTNLESLTTTVMHPKSNFADWAEAVILGSGLSRGMGAPVATWLWGFLTEAQRTQLKTFCTGASSTVVIRTKRNDGTFKYFACVMNWPKEEEHRSGYVLNFEIIFTHLVLLPDPPPPPPPP